MAVGENQPTGIFPLDQLKDAEPTEEVGGLLRWRGRRRLRINGELVRVTLEARKEAVDTGDGSFTIELERGHQAQKRSETWSILANRRNIPLLHLYLQHNSGPSLLLPQLPEPTQVARVYGDDIRLYSRFQDKFDSSSVLEVLATINAVTHTTLRSSQNNRLAPI